MCVCAIGLGGIANIAAAQTVAPPEPTGFPAMTVALAIIGVLAGLIIYLVSERRKAGTRLHEAEKAAERASAITDTTLSNMDQGLLMADAAGRIVVYNERLVEYLGIDPAAAATCRTVQDLSVLARSRTGDVATERALVLAREGGRANYEWVTDTRILDVRQNPLTDGGFIRTYTDITARKQVEERISMVVEAAPSGMIMVDREARIVLVNSHAEKVFGHPREKMIGQAIEMLVPERFRANHPALRNAFLRNPAPASLGAERGLFGLRSDGTEFPFELGLNPIKTSEGLFVLASVVDVTERMRAEAELKQSEERLALAMQAGRFTPWEADLKSGRTMTFSFYEQVLGYGPGELEDTLDSWKSIVHPDDVEPFGSAFRRFVDGKSSTFRFQYRARDREKNERWVEAVGTIVERDKSGTPTRIIGTQQDITERRKVELLAQERMRELEEFNRVAVGRELRMIELKEQINDLLAHMGRGRQYEIVE